MLKKFILICAGFQICFSMTVTDPTSYVYFMQQIQQMTKVMDSMTTQINTLGGIRSAIDESKRQIFNSQDNLTNVFTNLQNSIEDLQKATSNAEVKSLFSLSRDSISSYSREGLMYDTMQKEIQSYFNNSDKAVMSKFDRAGLVEFDKKMKQSIATLNGEKEIKSIDFNEVNKNLLIKDYLNTMQKKGKKAIHQMSIKMVNDTWNKHFIPDSVQREEGEKDKKRLSEYMNYIQNSSDIYQQTQTTNLLLYELIKLTKKEYESALHFRNAMALMFFDNSDNEQLVMQLRKNNESYKSLKNSGVLNVDPDDDLNRIKKLKNGNPYGFGFRPY